MASGSAPIRWSRLEPRSRDKSLAPGLEARVHDPLWLLGRQWQFGELTADGDLGSAIVAEVIAHVLPLARFRPGHADGNTAFRAYDVAAQPLETLVEAEDVRAAVSVRARARAGQHFERLLRTHGAARYAIAFREAFALGTEESLDAASRRFIGLLAGRVIDGVRLHAALTAVLRPEDGRTPALPETPIVDDGDVERVRAAAEGWLAWYDSLVTSPPGSNDAWIRDRMEYAFAVEAPAADGTGILLEAEEYTDGSLDWHSFTAASSTGPSGTSDVQVVGPRAVVPTAVTYPGMPASRLWEFEDARVDFGGVEANPEDLGRMLVTEFALVYGGDWLLVPLEAPTGSLVRIMSLDVRDTFGRVVRVNPTAALEPSSASWRMFGISPRASNAGASGSGAPHEGLLVAPALASGVQGRAIEEILLLRDEMANLAWAVERSIEGAHGVPVDRAAADYERRPDPPAASASPDTLVYRLRTDVPHHWLPLLPQRLQPDEPSMNLRLGALPSIGPDGTMTPIRPLGRLLAPAADNGEVVLREEEIPREGARVTRAYQLARWFDGTTFLWLGRRKAVGRGEGSSGLRFDVVNEL